MKTKKRWTEKEVNFLKDNYSSKGCKYCSNYLNKSFLSTLRKANRLKLTISRFLPLNTEYIIDEYINKTRTPKDIAKELNVSISTIDRILKRNNIPIHTRYDYATCGIKNSNWKGFGEISGSYWKHTEWNAKIRNLPFEISIEQIWELYLQQDRKCSLSGIDLHLNTKGYKYTAEITASIDRIDSSKGYTIDNVQWVHKTINLMKMHLSDTEFIKWCTLIVKENDNPSIITIKNPIDKVTSNKIWSIRGRTKKNKVELNIDTKYLQELLEKQNNLCALSKIKLDLNCKKQASIDRINPTLGYIKGNVQWVCNIINTMKFRHTQEEFINWCRKVVDYNK